MSEKKKKPFTKSFIGKSLIFLIKSPYYLGKGIYKGAKAIGDFTDKKIQEEKIENKREIMSAKYEKFRLLKTEKGDYNKWYEKIISTDSNIGVIIGARGTGKTAFAIKLLENIYAQKKKRLYAIGFKKEEMPLWIDVIENINEIKNNSFVLIDEGGILFSSRSSMSKPNKLLSELILIARHKNLSILFISQNSSNLEVNILRQADFLILKPSSLLQKDFERKIIQKIYDSSEKEFEKFKKDKGLTYIYSGAFKGFISNPLPSFWRESISKSFK